MAGTMGARSRKLMLARGPAVDSPVGVVWASVEVDLAGYPLREGERIVSDFVIDGELDEAVSYARRRDRVTADPEDAGRILDPYGVELGRVVVTKRGGRILKFS